MTTTTTEICPTPATLTAIYSLEVRADAGSETIGFEARDDDAAVATAVELIHEWIADGYDTSASTEWVHAGYTLTRADETSEECSYCDAHGVAVDAHGDAICAECAHGDVALGPVPAARVIVVDRDTVRVELSPPEPSCSHEDGHDWQGPHEIVGGLEDNPGVWGHGGGIIIREVCVRCGCGRETDTWAQDLSTGEQGLRSVSYTEGQYSDQIEPHTAA